MVRLNPLSRYDVESCYRAIRRLAKGKICSKSDRDGDEEGSSEAAWGSNEVRGKKRFAGDVETLDAVKQNVGEALALVELSLVATSVYSEQSTSRRKTLRHHGHFKFNKDAARIERDSREDGADCFSSRRSRCRVFERVERARSFQVVRRSTYHDDADAVARDGSKGGQGQGQGQGRNLRRSSSDRPRPRSSALVRPAENRLDERKTEEEEPLELAIVTDPDTGIKYRRGTLLGKGGFAKCFEFSDVKTKETFAVKVVSGARMADQRIREKIIREVEIHRHLEHPNVVTFYGFFESKGSAYLILENCTQRSMVHVMTKRKTLTEPEVRYYMLQLVSGCRYIHGRRFIHRDLKLGNMLLDDRMRIKIADFGLATKVLFDGEKKTSVCGTPNYIAPEVLQKKGYSYEADIWALGCVMYTMLCGQPPFETKSLKETYHRIVDGRFTTPGHVTPAAAQLMSRMLTVEPTARARLAKISADRFFVCGYNPATLPTFCCHSAPRFPPSAAERSRTWSVPRDFTVSKNFLPFFGRSLSDNTDKRLKKDGQNNIHPTRSKQTKAQEQYLSKTRQTQYQLSKSSINKTTTITNDKTKEIEKDPSGILADSQSNRNSFEKNLKLIDIKNSSRQTSLNKLDEIDISSLSQQTNVGEMHEVSFEPLFQMMREAVKQSETKESKEPSSSSSSASSSSSSSTSSLDISSFGHCPLWITKWIDYSRKYGFGYQLSDGRYGILFSESGHILLSQNKKSVSYSSRVTSSESKSFSVDNVPTKLQQKVQVVRNLADCMTKRLVDGGGGGGGLVGARRSSEAAGKGGEPVVGEPADHILLQKWRRDSNVILLQLNNGTLQVNCLKDRSKTVISRSPLKSGDYFLTRVCRGRPAVTWPLESSVKADPKVVDVLRLALKLVDETIEDDNRAARSFARWRH